MTTPTRDELEGAGDSARRRLIQAAHAYASAPEIYTRVKDPYHKALKELRIALDAYGAACRALGERDGRLALAQAIFPDSDPEEVLRDYKQVGREEAEAGDA